MRDLIRIDFNFDVNDFDALAHFQDVLIEIDQIVDKIVAKKTKKTSNLKSKNFVSCFIVNDLNDDDDNNNNDNNVDFFFRF